ncbi:hypothetical protein KC726_03210 [Candidatus Woesebacteria bacterium]|nr:hypothetical protein [Candidatus Woesebacteria bacterium]
MVKKLFIIVAVIFSFLLVLSSYTPVQAQIGDIGNIYDIAITPIPCNRQQPDLSCPIELEQQYDTLGETCAPSYENFQENPTTSHYWIEDPNITALGKGDERARQFLYWVINTNAIDSAPVLGDIWTISSIVATVGIVLVAAIFGIGFIVSQKTQFGFNIKIQVMPTLIKLGTMLLYVALSAGIVFVLISLSEVLMKFFIENLGGRDLFNIYFANTGVTPNILGQTEQSYKSFIGCRDLNVRVQEGIQSEVFLLKMTNITYYVMGVMLLLRKILLWFMLFVAPFLALLMPFVFIRNTGWIWIGVFFQWLFYGPLLALFLGATSTIWKKGIPFNFDFSRVSSDGGYIYPTGINIVYGGPAQRIQGLISRPIGALNNGNYVDTFAEYVITLIMLWAVTFFPWWLLRIFRDYCCDGIYASRNILLAMYDQMRGGPSTGPTPGPAPTLPTLKVDTKTPVSQNVNVSIGDLAQIRKTVTRDITKNLSMQANKLTSVAQIEMNKNLKQTVKQNIAYLANPVQAQVPVQRQQFMQLRSELFNRAIKNDSAAQRILASTSMTKEEKIRARNTIIRSLPKMQSVNQVVQSKTKIGQTAATSIANAYAASLVNNKTIINEIVKQTNVPEPVVLNIIQNYSHHLSAPAQMIVPTLAKENKTSTENVKNVLSVMKSYSTQFYTMQQTKNRYKLSENQVRNIVESVKSAFGEAKSVIDRMIPAINLSSQVATTALQQMTNQVVQNQDLVNQIAQRTGVSAANVSSVVSAYQQTSDQPVANVANAIMQKTQLSERVITSIVSALPSITIDAGEPIIEILTKRIENKAESSAQAITNIIKNMSTNTTLVQSVSTETTVPQTTIASVLNELSQNIAQRSSQTIQTIVQKTQTTAQHIQSIFSFAAQYVENNPTIVKELQQNTHLSEQAVTSVVNEMSTIAQQQPVAQTVAKAAQIPVEKAVQIAQAVPATVSTQAPAQATTESTQPTQTAQQTQINQEKVASIMRDVFTSAVHDETTIKTIAQQTNLKPQQVVNVMNTYAEHINEPPEQLIQTIYESSGIDRGRVRSVMDTTTGILTTSQAILGPIAQKEQVKEEEVADVVNTQMELAVEPEKHIERTIEIPKTVSIEDYEEVKDMWTKHYEDGEVPVSETIKTRKEWVEQEIVYITNTLNKILSNDEEVRQDGLDELGYLLPIFLINNLKGDELIVYLKAKLEAAKATDKLLARESKIRQEYDQKDTEENLVEVKRTKTEENTKHMTVDDEPKQTPGNIEDRVKAVQDKLNAAESTNNIDSIQQKLQDEAEN